jgi:hypothetical protein
MICKCGEQYRRRYKEGEIIPPGTAAVRGTGVHGGSKVNFSQKIESKDDLTTEEVVEASLTAFKGAWEKGVKLLPEEKAIGMAKVKGQTQDSTVTLAKMFHEQRAILYQPKLVEEGFRIVLPDCEMDLMGYLDFLGIDIARPQEDLILDLKTSGKSKGQADVDHSIQLTSYAAGACILSGADQMKVKLEVAVATKTPKTQSLESTRDAKDFSCLDKRVRAAADAIKAGNYLPAPVGAWWCSPKWCGYWSTCPYVRS